MNKFNIVLTTSFVGYLFFLLVGSIFIGFKENIPAYIYIMQLCIAVVFFGVLKLFEKSNSTKKGLYVIPILLLICTFFFRYLFTVYTGDPYNLVSPLDTRAYEAIAVRYQDYGYTGFIKDALRQGEHIDDLGYSSVYYLAQSLMQNINASRNLVSFFHAIATLISARYLYKILLIVNVSNKLSLMCAVFYGMFPFFTVFSTMGLKEDIFCLLIVAAFYHTYMFKHGFAKYHLMLSLISILLTFFFRTIITLMLIFVFVIAMYCNEKNKKKSIVLISIAGTVVLIFLPVIVLNFTNVSMDFITNVSNYRVGDIGYGPIVLSAIFGPFPNFVRVVQYAILLNSGLLAKCFMGFFAYFGVYMVIKRLDYKLYPFVGYWLMGIVFTIISGVALDIRYQITFFIAFVVLAAYGMQNSQSYHRKWFALYSLFVSGIILFYNLR